ncbi:MAG: AAA family ATPase [Candidatus Aenigmatarchaeota archaeon]
MNVIGITGLMGSGVDTVAKYISEKYGYAILHMSDILREMAKKEGLELTRDNLQNMRKKYGNEFLAEEIVKRIKKNKYNKVIIAAIRRSEDYLIPKKEFPEMKLIFINTDDKIRFERLKKRCRENDPKTFKEFQRQQKNEYKIYDFNKTFSYADYVIENNGTVDELYKKVDEIMRTLEN